MKNLFFSLSMTVPLAVFAGDLDARVSKLESTSAKTTVESYADQPISLSATTYPAIQDSCHIKLEIGAVYQSIQVGGTEFAVEISELSFENILIDGNVLSPKSHMNWGLNLAASYVPFLEEYDLRLANSYFESNNTFKKSSAGILPLNTTDFSFFISAIGFGFSFASSNLKTGYDLLSLEIGRATNFSKKFSVHPVFGLTSLWLWLAQKNTYSVADGEDFAGESLYENMKNDWFGIGPSTGVNTNLALNKNISVFFDTKGAIMYGSFKNNHSSILTEAGEEPFQISKISDKKVIPYLEFIIGGAYEFFDEQDRNHFKLRAGYDLKYFFSANKNLINLPVGFGPGEYQPFQESGVYRANEDISTQGLILDLAWSF